MTEGKEGPGFVQLGIGDTVPNFTAQTQLGSITLWDFISGSWAVIVSFPADYSPVCTTEIGTLSKIKGEFDARNCKLLGISTDSVERHEGWIKDINETQDTDVTFPLISDEKGSILNDYGSLHPNAEGMGDSELPTCVRGVYLIDPERKLQLRLTYPISVGRNFFEIIRVLDSLQITSYHQVATPANWKVGEDVVILPSVTDDTAADLFPKGFTSIKPYLRITPQPDQ